MLNLTTMVTSHSGKSFCVSATWNDKTALDQTRFAAIYSTFLGALT